MIVQLAQPLARGFDPSSIFTWRVQGYAYDILAQGAADRSDLTRQLYRRYKANYLHSIEVTAQQLGYEDVTARLSDRTIINQILGSARKDANSIIATHNRDLAYGLKNTTGAWYKEKGSLKGLNRHILGKRTNDWATWRNQWKKPQIALDQVQKAQQRALEDFLVRSGIEGKAHVEPLSAVCDDCKDAVAWGSVDLKMMHDAPFPFHLNCVHWWVIEVDLESLPAREDLWLGGPIEWAR